MTLTHRPFQSLLPKSEVPRLPPPEPEPGEPRCRLCKRLWSDEPGLAYCKTQHGSCGLCKAPRVRCRCLAPTHWTGTRVPAKPFESSEPTAVPEEKPMEEKPVSDAPNPKIEFVLQHPDAPAKEVADMAAKAGMELSPDYVHAIRSTARKNKLPGAPKKKVGNPGGRPPSERSAFTRTFAFDAPVKEVVKAARAAGIKNLTHDYVVATRGRDKANGRLKWYGKPMPPNTVIHARTTRPKTKTKTKPAYVAPVAPRQKSQGATAVAVRSQRSDDEQQFIGAVGRMGIARAVELLQEMQAAWVRALSEMGR